MTDEERQEACEALRNGNAHYWKQEWYNELADEIERLAKELANANRLLEINCRRSLEKSGGLEIKQSDAR